jgi:hypothetical protein
MPMRFAWHQPAGDCSAPCRSFISAVGLITADTPDAFEQFLRTRDAQGATIVLDSSGGSVVDAIALGRRWRDLGLTTTVGTTINLRTAQGERSTIMPDAFCESMCVFLLLSGSNRHVPEGAHVRVHQIWMGDRADDARGASYTADDITVIQRDIGRLAAFAFDMGAGGELLGLALSRPPWEPLRELSATELRSTHLINAGPEVVADLVYGAPSVVEARLARGMAKPTQDRFVSSVVNGELSAQPVASTRTAEAMPPSAVPPKTTEPAGR